MTWSYITTQNSPDVLFETPSQGYPIPVDTQLTNPLQPAWHSVDSAVIEQAEPNGLFSSKNSDATYVMALNDDGTVSPIYTELKVTTFPFPVEWDSNLKRWVRTEGKPTISINLTKKAAESTKAEKTK